MLEVRERLRWDGSLIEPGLYPFGHGRRKIDLVGDETPARGLCKCAIPAQARGDAADLVHGEPELTDLETLFRERATGVSFLDRAASETVVGRAARCPMVLLDFNFQRVAWWSQVVNEQPFGDRRPNLSVFPSEEAIPLARDLLLEAWSAARSMSRVSSLVFGMAPEVTTLISRLSPRDIDQVVVQEIQALRPRWENRPMFWKALFHAAAQMDDQILGNVHLHCLQLLGGELASSRRPRIG